MVFQKYAARVPQPDTVRRPTVKTNVVGERFRTFENSVSLPRRRGIVDDQFDPLVPREIANDLGINPWDGLELSRPVALVMRPCEPRGGVRFPLGGHPIAKCSGNSFNR